MLNPKLKEESEEYLATLDKEQLLVYHMVMKERLRIYEISTIVGIVAGFIVMMLCPQGALLRGCAFLSTVFLVQYFCYILMPKEYSMLSVLKEDQLDEWQEVYREYQWSFHLGLLVGLVGYFVFGYGW